MVLARGGRSSLPAIRPRSCSQSLSLTTALSKNPLASSMFSNIFESSRARLPGSLYLARSFSGSLFNIPLKFANPLPGTVLNCWLITRETSCFFFLSNPRFNFRSSDLFFFSRHVANQTYHRDGLDPFFLPFFVIFLFFFFQPFDFRFRD